ncbi:Inosine/uridine-preferring nucleoside hydrolase domain-containing protein [Xylaria sp. CBS 124048]|nr:Inosine/uridine-preferring nucleoside hydrolase domain-containing protein [Xylaria sp. CBS 124048]
MTPKRRIIIDTDPGTDDVLAMLLALASSPEDLEIMLISVTYGNVTLENCVRNVVALFKVLDLEMQWRETQGRPLGFDVLRAFKPIVAMGPEHALEDEMLMADEFHGTDGLHGVHEAHPHLSPEETWKALFKHDHASPDKAPSYHQYFKPSKAPAHQEILRILREEPIDTVSICALGPLTNLALAASEDPETFLRVKEVAVMGGAIAMPGNVTPVAEFNTYADAVATARVFALTSATPSSTMSPVPQSKSTLPPYPEKLSRKLNVSLFPLDITTNHLLNINYFQSTIAPQLAAGSPLATWVNTFMQGIFRHLLVRDGDAEEPGLSLHDPLIIWYMLTGSSPEWKLAAGTPEDIRVETSGQWTHGMHISDRRGRVRADGRVKEEIEGDKHGWLSAKRGNRINRYVSSPGFDAFAPYLMTSLFG